MYLNIYHATNLEAENGGKTSLKSILLLAFNLWWGFELFWKKTRSGCRHQKQQLPAWRDCWERLTSPTSNCGPSSGCTSAAWCFDPSSPVLVSVGAPRRWTRSFLVEQEGTCCWWGLAEGQRSWHIVAACFRNRTVVLGKQKANCLTARRDVWVNGWWMWIVCRQTQKKMPGTLLLQTRVVGHPEFVFLYVCGLYEVWAAKRELERKELLGLRQQALWWGSLWQQGTPCLRMLQVLKLHRVQICWGLTKAKATLREVCVISGLEAGRAPRRGTFAGLPFPYAPAFVSTRWCWLETRYAAGSDRDSLLSRAAARLVLWAVTPAVPWRSGLSTQQAELGAPASCPTQGGSYLTGRPPALDKPHNCLSLFSELTAASSSGLGERSCAKPGQEMGFVVRVIPTAWEYLAVTCRGKRKILYLVEDFASSSYTPFLELTPWLRSSAVSNTPKWGRAEFVTTRGKCPHTYVLIYL